MSGRRIIYGYDDDEGQVDGDTSGSAQFQPALASVDHPWMREGLPPWHMWGGTVNLTVDSAQFASSFVGTNVQQLAKVSYKRPETWSFFFGARLTGTVPLDAQNIAIVFDVITGVGRTSFATGPQPLAADPFDTSGFVKFVWAVPAAGVPLAQPVKYATQGFGPPVDDRAPTSGRAVEWLSAQDIQVSVRMIVLPDVEPVPVIFTAEASCYFAPRSHVRPDWYLPPPAPAESRFPGSETGGR